jgi:hypothetical protein
MLYDKNSFVTENNAVRNGRKREVIMSRYTKNDIFRMVIYIKQEKYSDLMGIKNYLEGYFAYSEYFAGCNLMFDFDPMSSY